MMAEFCKQCAEALGLPPDWKGLLSRKDALRGFSLGPMLCEGCGPCFIDHEGRCLGCKIHPRVTTKELIASAGGKQ